MRLFLKRLLVVLMIVPMPAGLHGGGGPQGCVATPDGLHLIIDMFDKDFRQASETLSVYASVDNSTTTIPPVDVLESAIWDADNEQFICHVDKLYVRNCTISKSGTRIILDLMHRFEKYLVQQRPSSNSKDTQMVSFTCFDPFAFSSPLPESEKPEKTSNTGEYIAFACAVLLLFLLIMGVIAWLFKKHEFLQWARQKLTTLLRICPKSCTPKWTSTNSTSNDVSITFPETEMIETMKTEIMSLQMKMEQMETYVHSHITEDIRSQIHQKMEEMKTHMTEWLRGQIRTEAASDFVETGIVRLREDVDPQVASENPKSCTVATINPESAYFSLPVNSISGVQSSMQCPPNSSRPSRDPPPNREEIMMPSGSSQTQRQAAAAPASGGSNTRVSSTDDQAVTVSSSHAPSPEPAPSDSSTPIAFKPQSAVGKDAAHSSGAGSDKQCPAPPPTHKKEVMTQSGPPRTPTQVAAASVFDFNTRATEDQALAMSSSLAPSRELAPSDSPPPIARKPKPAVLNDAATTSGAGSDKQCPAPPPAHKEEVMTQSGPLGTPTQVPSGVSEVQDAMNVQIGEFKENKGGQRGERRSQTPNITFQPALKR